MDNSVFYQNLEPFSFLERSAFVYPDKPAVIYKDRVYTYSELRDRVNRLAGALKSAGVAAGATASRSSSRTSRRCWRGTTVP